MSGNCHGAAGNSSNKLLPKGAVIIFNLNQLGEREPKNHVVPAEKPPRANTPVRLRGVDTLNLTYCAAHELPVLLINRLCPQGNNSVKDTRQLFTCVHAVCFPGCFAEVLRKKPVKFHRGGNRLTGRIVIR